MKRIQLGMTQQLNVMRHIYASCSQEFLLPGALEAFLT